MGSSIFQLNVNRCAFLFRSLFRPRVLSHLIITLSHSLLQLIFDICLIATIIFNSRSYACTAHTFHLLISTLFYWQLRTAWRIRMRQNNAFVMHCRAEKVTRRSNIGIGEMHDNTVGNYVRATHWLYATGDLNQIHWYSICSLMISSMKYILHTDWM